MWSAASFGQLLNRFPRFVAKTSDCRNNSIRISAVFLFSSDSRSNFASTKNKNRQRYEKDNNSYTHDG
jgi:hypothetical protein